MTSRVALTTLVTLPCDRVMDVYTYVWFVGVSSIQDKTAYKEYMEANGYRTLKELHNGEFFVHDFIFVADKLYKSLRRRQMIEDSKLPVWTRAGAVNRTMIQLQLD